MSHAHAAAPVSRHKAVLQALGPGLLFAAAAVGVSHLVQSTRAGAEYGLGLLGMVVLANALKYPAFRFGPLYAAATGKCLLQGYRRQGRWALAIYGLVTVATMFAVQAAIVLVTAGLAVAALGLSASPLVVATVLNLLSAALLMVGDYRWLDRVSKALVVVLTLSTVVATALVLPRIPWSTLGVMPRVMFEDVSAAFFTAALVGWMPSAIDVSVWHSLWAVAKIKDNEQAPSLEAASFDFHLGYLGSAVLAMCFVMLGAGVMFNAGQSFPNSPTAFAAQVISLYTETLGAWTRPLIGVSALAVMFSTLLTVVDGFPRALASLAETYGHAEGAPAGTDGAQNKRWYWGSLVVLGAGSLAIIAWFLSSLQVLVDLATTLSFLTAPVLSWLNHRAVLGPEVPPEARPSPALRWGSAVAIFLQAAFAVLYVILRARQ